MRARALCFDDLEATATRARDLPFTYLHLAFDLPATTVLHMLPVLPTIEFVVTPVSAFVELDTLDELEYYRNGGILHYVLRQLAA